MTAGFSHKHEAIQHRSTHRLDYLRVIDSRLISFVIAFISLLSTLAGRIYVHVLGDLINWDVKE